MRSSELIQTMQLNLKKARPDARRQLQQRADSEGRGASHRLRLPHVQAPGGQVQPGQNLRDCQGHRQHPVRVPQRK